jgi:hypothetical protein
VTVAATQTTARKNHLAYLLVLSCCSVITCWYRRSDPRSIVQPPAPAFGNVTRGALPSARKHASSSVWAKGKRQRVLERECPPLRVHRCVGVLP